MTFRFVFLLFFFYIERGGKNVRNELFSHFSIFCQITDLCCIWKYVTDVLNTKYKFVRNFAIFGVCVLQLIQVRCLFPLQWCTYQFYFDITAVLFPCFRLNSGCKLFNWKERSVFSPNVGKNGPEKLPIRSLFTQCIIHSIFHLCNY